MRDSDTSRTEGSPDLDLEHLHSMEKQQVEDVSRSRVHPRVEAKLQVTVLPANASELRRFRLRGVSADISRGGCRLVLSAPVGVGDVFRLEFASDELRVPLLFARCLRCRLIREGAFEAAFQFFGEIELPASLSPAQDDLPR